MSTKYSECILRLVCAGFALHDAIKLRRIAMVLHRWHELECGDGNNYASWAIERDEETDTPYLCTYPHKGKNTRRKIPDKEAGAKRRLAGIMKNYPGFASYVQGDPRGAPLYIIRLNDLRHGEDVASVYHRGIAVYK